MPHEYFCRACDVVSPERRDHRETAEDDRDAHRQAAHGGLAPGAGDGVRQVHSAARGDGCLPKGSFWAALFFLAVFVANCRGPWS